MWPVTVDWKSLKFGVEIEFVGGYPDRLELLPNWMIALDELQIDDTGEESGSELQTPPMVWEEREQIRVMLSRLKEQGAQVNWSCGLHIHVSLAPWGQEIIVPILDAALLHQQAIQSLVRTSPHRLVFCPPVTAEMRRNFIAEPGEDAVRHRGRPQSHRCGINTASWFDIGTVEIRYANGSLDYKEILNTIELCLRFVAAVGEGRTLAAEDPLYFASELGAPTQGYPPPVQTPRWFQERMWLEQSLIPALSRMAAELVQDGEIHHILPVPEGILLAIENRCGKLRKYVVQPPAANWTIIREVLE